MLDVDAVTDADPTSCVNSRRAFKSRKESCDRSRDFQLHSGPRLKAFGGLSRQPILLRIRLPLTEGSIVGSQPPRSPYQKQQS